MIVAVMLAMLSQASVQAPAPPPDRPAGVTAPTPDGDPGRWVTPGDYPLDALHKGLQGVVGFRVAVDARGNATGCTVIRSSGVASLDDATCQLIMARAHFNPARDARHRPVGDSFASRVKWVVPAEPKVLSSRPLDLPPPESPHVLVISYILEPDGTHTDCRIERAESQTGDAGHIGPIPCFGARSSTGYIDTQGQAERRRVTLTMSTTLDPVR